MGFISSQPKSTYACAHFVWAARKVRKPKYNVDDEWEDYRLPSTYIDKAEDDAYDGRYACTSQQQSEGESFTNPGLLTYTRQGIVQAYGKCSGHTCTANYSTYDRNSGIGNCACVFNCRWTWRCHWRRWRSVSEDRRGRYTAVDGALRQKYVHFTFFGFLPNIYAYFGSCVKFSWRYSDKTGVALSLYVLLQYQERPWNWNRTSSSIYARKENCKRQVSANNWNCFVVSRVYVSQCMLRYTVGSAATAT